MQVLGGLNMQAVVHTILSHVFDGINILTRNSQRRQGHRHLGPQFSEKTSDVMESQTLTSSAHCCNPTDLMVDSQPRLALTSGLGH